MADNTGAPTMTLRDVTELIMLRLDTDPERIEKVVVALSWYANQFDRMLKTANGVPVYHGMRVWHPDDIGEMDEDSVVVIHTQNEGGFGAC